MTLRCYILCFIVLIITNFSQLPSCFKHLNIFLWKKCRGTCCIKPKFSNFYCLQIATWLTHIYASNSRLLALHMILLNWILSSWNHTIFFSQKKGSGPLLWWKILMWHMSLMWYGIIQVRRKLSLKFRWNSLFYQMIQWHRMATICQ